MRTIAVVLLLASAAAPQLGAQRLTDSRTAAAQSGLPAPVAGRTTIPETSRPTGSMVTTGIAFAAGGLVAGAYAGPVLMCGSSTGDYCDLGGAIIGALVGEMVLLPLGVHVASDASSFAKKLLVSTGVMAGSILLAPVTAGISLLAAPVVQLTAVIALEQSALDRRR